MSGAKRRQCDSSIDAATGPDTLDAVFDWPRQFASQLASRGSANLVLRMLSTLNMGILLCTDYSGIGGVEIALHSIASYFAMAHGIAPLVRFWSASDLIPYCRGILMDARGSAKGYAHAHTVIPFV